MAALGERDDARRVEAMVARHGPALLRVANQFSLCHDDALDAYQRALEIYLRRLDTVDRATEGAWLRVVTRRTFVPNPLRRCEIYAMQPCNRS